MYAEVPKRQITLQKVTKKKTEEAADREEAGDRQEVEDWREDGMIANDSRKEKAADDRMFFVSRYNFGRFLLFSYKVFCTALRDKADWYSEILTIFCSRYQQ